MSDEQIIEFTKFIDSFGYEDLEKLGNQIKDAFEKTCLNKKDFFHSLSNAEQLEFLILFKCKILTSVQLACAVADKEISLDDVAKYASAEKFGIVSVSVQFYKTKWLNA